MKRVDLLHLIDHPLASEIGEQLVAMEDSDERFGEYVGMPFESDINRLSDPGNNDPLLERVLISPDRLERAVGLGSFAIYGVTDRGKRAFVSVETSTRQDSKGHILLFD